MPTAVAELARPRLVRAGRSAPSSSPRSSGMVVGGDLGDRRGPRPALLAGVGGLRRRPARRRARRRHGRLRRRPRACRASAAASSPSRSTSSPGRPTRRRCARGCSAPFSAAWVLPALVGPARGRPGHRRTLGWRLVFLGLLPLIAVGLAARAARAAAAGARPTARPRRRRPGAGGRCWPGSASPPCSTPGSGSTSLAVGLAVVGLAALVARAAAAAARRHRAGCGAGLPGGGRRPRAAGRRLLRHGRAAAARPDRAARLRPGRRRASR